MKKMFGRTAIIVVSILFLILVYALGSYIYAKGAVNSLLTSMRRDDVRAIYKITGKKFTMFNGGEWKSIYDYIEIGKENGAFSLPNGTLKKLDYNVTGVSFEHFPYVLVFYSLFLSKDYICIVGIIA